MTVKIKEILKKVDNLTDHIKLIYSELEEKRMEIKILKGARVTVAEWEGLTGREYPEHSYVWEKVGDNWIPIIWGHTVSGADCCYILEVPEGLK